MFLSGTRLAFPEERTRKVAKPKRVEVKREVTISLELCVKFAEVVIKRLPQLSGRGGITQGAAAGAIAPSV
jgi:hypothetical protein